MKTNEKYSTSHFALLRWKRTFKLIPRRNPICLCVVTHVRDSWFLASVRRATWQEACRPTFPSGKSVGFPTGKKGRGGEGTRLHQRKSGLRLLAKIEDFLSAPLACLGILLSMSFAPKGAYLRINTFQYKAQVPC